MTYEEKLAINLLETIAPDSTQLGTYTNIELVAEKINQAMQAQREADAQQAMLAMMQGDDTPDLAKQAILNAEVKI